jgi:hypothetical protein
MSGWLVAFWMRAAISPPGAAIRTLTDTDRLGQVVPSWVA